MASYKTHTLTYDGRGRIGRTVIPKANDLHINFGSAVEVLGVNGIPPSDSNAPYTLEGDGSVDIDIKDMASVGAHGSVKVRVKNDGRPAAPINAAATHWTYNGNAINGGLLLAALDTDEIGEEAALAMTSVLFSIDDKLDKLIGAVSRITPGN